MAFDGLSELIRRDEARDAGKPIDEPAEDEPAKNPHAVALGRMGGLKGGKARAEKLSARRKKQIAKKAAEARWSKKAN
ncbi:MAG: histone H1 [Blastocatellia bacterium]